MNNKILLLPHYSNKRRFAISLDALTFEADPRIYTCVTRPSRAHVRRVWHETVFKALGYSYHSRRLTDGSFQ